MATRRSICVWTTLRSHHILDSNAMLGKFLLANRDSGIEAVKAPLGTETVSVLDGELSWQTDLGLSLEYFW